MNTSKIIKGVVSNGKYTVTAPIVKEDYGLYLQIEGVELPETYQVDFSNSENSGSSVTMIGNADGVLIPRQFIDSGKDVFAFLYHVGADYGRTVYKFRIPNKVRPDRTNEEPTPEEQSVIDQTINALNEAVAQTAEDVINADASAQSASQSAESAEQSAQTSRGWAESAEDYAQSAEQSELQASASALASAQSASNAQGYASQASQSAQDASESATASAQSASQASASEQGCARAVLDAASAAAIARARADEASGYAQTASSKATEASGYASTASQKATEASQSATNAQGYAQTAEQAKTDAQTAQGLAEQARDTAVQAKTDAESARDDAESARDEAQSIVDGISGALDDKADIITDTASGSIASFPDGADNLPLKSLVIDINPIQDLSNGDPSPENICPISGWTQVDVNHSDADMTNPTTITIDLGQTVYGGHLDVLSGVLTVDRAMAIFNGTETYNNNYFPIVVCNKTFTKGNASGNSFVNSHLPSLNAACNYASSTKQVFQFGKANEYWGVSSADELKAIFAQQYANGIPVTICYPLAEPVEIQLTPNQVNSLLGVNNIWADSGDTEAVYRADTKAWVQRKITEAVAAALNS